MRQPRNPITALVVTFNRLSQLQTTLAALLSSDEHVLARVIVVDSASTDGTGDWLADQTDPRILTLTLAENRGGANGFASGLAAFQALPTQAPGRDWVVLMDDDGRPLPDTLAAFTAVPRDNAQAWLAAVHYPDGSLCEMNRPWRRPFADWRTALATLRRGRAGFHVPDTSYTASAPQAVHGGSFVGMFLHRKAIEMAGLPRADLFLYGDDVLFSLALSQAGGQIMFDAGLRFEHDCATMSQAGPSVTPLWKVYYLQRNRIFMYRVAAGPVLIWPVMALFAARWWYAQRHYHDTDRRAYKRLCRIALMDGLRGHTRRTHAEIASLSQV
ncbi:MAG: glycosyltransferase [Pseudomonadota bacterium]